MKRYLLATLFVTTACGGEPPKPPVVRDSAGVTIVENFDPTWSGGEAWSLSGQPILAIGDSSRGEDYVLERVVGALRMPDGSVVVGNGGTQQLRWYDSTGTHLFTAGRGGRDGSRFSYLQWLGRFGEEAVLAYDGTHLRTTIIANDGTLLHSGSLIITFRAQPGDVRGLFADSTLLVVRGAGHWVRSMQGEPDAPQGLRRAPTIAFRYDHDDGRYINTIGTFPGSERIFRTGRTQIVHVDPRPFGKNAVLAASGEDLYAGTQDSYEISVVHNSDSLAALIRLNRPKQPVTQEHIDRYKSARLANVHPREREHREARLDSLPYPDWMPAYSTILVDTEGNLWVSDYRPFGLQQPVWTVFDPSHRVLGTVETPLRLTIHDVGPDYVLGRWREPSGAESVRIYALEKPGG